MFCLLSVQIIFSSSQKSVTVDEIMYIAAGFYHLKTGDFQFNMTNPPLAKCLSAIPLLGLNLELPDLKKGPEKLNIIEQWQFSRQFLYGNVVNAEKILLLSRIPTLILSIILGIYLFSWAKRLFNERAGILALVFYVFSPNILAHSRLATLDLALTVFMFISLYYFWLFMIQPKLKNIILCGICVSLSIMTKSTGFFLIIIFFIFIVISIARDNKYGIYHRLPFIKHTPHSRNRYNQFITSIWFFLIIGAVSIFILNTGYLFQDSFEPLSKGNNKSNIHQKLPINNFFTRYVADIILETPFPLPKPYVQTLKSQFLITEEKTESQYFAGRLYPSARKYFMIAALLIKTPIPVLLLFIYSLVTLKNRKENIDSEILIITQIIFILGLFSYLNIYNAGLRYILPIYPLIFLITSQTERLIHVENYIKKFSFIVLICWYITGTIFIYPDYLAYFNETIGGAKNGYKYMVQSNLDWGQDLKQLKRYLDEKGIKKIKLGYYGSADANYYNIDYEYLPSVGLKPQGSKQNWWYEIDSEAKIDCRQQKGLIAVSATLLRSPGWMTRLFGSCYQWLNEHEPVDNIGHSILIYKIDQ